MAILRVAQAGHPVLRRRAAPVDPSAIPSDDFQRFCDNLLETMLDYDGAGLAAPQVHVSARVAVMVLSDERGPEFFVNPVVTSITDELIRNFEGCLSLEGIRAAVWRPAAVRVQALDRDGTPKIIELHGFPAVVVQHECDHLDGVLFIDRCDTRTFTFLSEYRRFGPIEFDDDGQPVLQEEGFSEGEEE